MKEQERSFDSLQNDASISDGQAGAKETLVEPKLTYLTPKLVKRGDVAKVTAGFFGTFSP